jgi:acyl carrier protein
MADTTGDVHTKIRSIVASQLTIDEALVEPSKAFTDLGLDELDLSEIVMRLEEQFGLEISDEDAHQFISVEAVETYLINKK